MSGGKRHAYEENAQKADKQTAVCFSWFCQEAGKTALKAVLAITSMGDFEKLYVTEAEDGIDCWVIVEGIDIMDDLMLTRKAMDASEVLKREIRCRPLSRERYGMRTFRRKPLCFKGESHEPG